MAGNHPENASRPLLLVVEDEMLVRMCYEDAAEEAGVAYVSAASVAEALDVLSLDVDAAILDIRLGEERVFPVAYRLIEMGIPFLFCSGTGGDMPEGVFSEIPLVQKPAPASQVIARALELAIED